MVARVIRNPILKGWRFRNRRKSLRGKNGHYRSVPADPAETKWRHVPHLAFFEEHAWDTLIEKLDAKNAAYSRGRCEAAHSRQIRGPRKRTRFPGQMTFCGMCGRMYVFGGHGLTHHLMCDGARQYTCWNGVTFDSVLATRKILEAVHQEIAALPEFDPAFLTVVNAEAERLDEDRAARRHALELAVAKATRELEHLVQFVAAGSDSIAVRNRLRETEQELARLQGQLRSTKDERSLRIEIPSMDELRALASLELSSLPLGSFQFQQLMQRLIPRIVIFPVMPCDGGRAVCRAQFRLHLGNFLSQPSQRDVLAQPLERLLTVDLFNVPQRIEHLEQIESLRRQMSERAVARQLGITVTAAQKSSALRRKMLQLGLADPYVAVTDPELVPRLNRHHHPRYRFSPRPDSGQV